MTTIFQDLDRAVADAQVRLEALQARQPYGGQLPLPGLAAAGGPGPLPFREKNHNKHLLEADNG